eukprot:3021644-Alexandrium_andersonii.AAC.1
MGDTQVKPFRFWRRRVERPKRRQIEKPRRRRTGRRGVKRGAQSEQPRLKVNGLRFSSVHPPVASACSSVANARSRIGAPLGLSATAKTGTWPTNLA